MADSAALKNLAAKAATLWRISPAGRTLCANAMAGVLNFSYICFKCRFPLWRYKAFGNRHFFTGRRKYRRIVGSRIHFAPELLAIFLLLFNRPCLVSIFTRILPAHPVHVFRLFILLEYSVGALCLYVLFVYFVRIFCRYVMSVYLASAFCRYVTSMYFVRAFRLYVMSVYLVSAFCLYVMSMYFVRIFCSSSANA